jgi:hypothetical protein
MEPFKYLPNPAEMTGRSHVKEEPKKSKATGDKKIQKTSSKEISVP